MNQNDYRINLVNQYLDKLKLSKSVKEYLKDNNVQVRID